MRFGDRIASGANVSSCRRCFRVTQLSMTPNQIRFSIKLAETIIEQDGEDQARAYLDAQFPDWIARSRDVVDELMKLAYQSPRASTSLKNQVLRQARRISPRYQYLKDPQLITKLEEFNDYDWGNLTGAQVLGLKNYFEKEIEKQKRLALSGKYGRGQKSHRHIQRSN